MSRPHCHARDDTRSDVQSLERMRRVAAFAAPTAVPTRSFPGAMLLAATLLSVLAMLFGGAVLGQSAPGEARQSIEEASGHVPPFEVLERSAGDALGATISVSVEATRDVSPEVIVVGPDGLVLQETGTSFSFADLPPGDYLVSATAERMRAVSGTLNLIEGEAAHVALRLFNQRRYYADETDTPILGVFEIDVADNVADPRGTLVINVEPSGTAAVVAGDGFTRIFVEAAETWTLDDLEADRYVVAVTGEGAPMVLTTVVIEEEELVTLDVVLEELEP